MFGRGEVGKHNIFIDLPLILIPLLFFLWNGLAGIDFGYHWDEPFMIRSAQQSIDTGRWLPTFYNYPSATYWLTISSTLPEIITGETLTENDYILRARPFFLLVTSTTIVFTYAIIRVLHVNRFMAFISASLIALSWEVGYHARWIAPDGLMMAAGTLTLLLCLVAIRNPNKKYWLWLAAIAVGLTLSSKYNGGLVGIYLLGAVWITWREHQDTWRDLLITLLQIGLISAATYLIITPGTLLDSAKFSADVTYEFNHYREFGHVNNTVTPGLEHAWLLAQYFGMVVFSPIMPIALFIAAFIPVGVYALWQCSRQTTLLLFSFPVVYFLFMSSQRVMIVRNVLILIPPLAILAACGMAFVWTHLRFHVLRGVSAVVNHRVVKYVGLIFIEPHPFRTTHPTDERSPSPLPMERGKPAPLDLHTTTRGEVLETSRDARQALDGFFLETSTKRDQKIPYKLSFFTLRGAFAITIISMLLVNGNWLVNATDTIRQRDDFAGFVRDAGEYITNNADTTFCLSGGMYWWFDQIGFPPPANTKLPGDADIDYIMYVTDEVERTIVGQNQPDLYERWFGAYEVNYNYYSNWEGEQRVVLIEAEKALPAEVVIGNCLLES